jgi:hypothetical protein
MDFIKGDNLCKKKVSGTKKASRCREAFIIGRNLVLTILGKTFPQH